MVQPDLPGTRVRLSTIAAHSDDPDGVVPRLTQVEQGPVPPELRMVSPELLRMVSPELQELQRPSRRSCVWCPRNYRCPRNYKADAPRSRFFSARGAVRRVRQRGSPTSWFFGLAGVPPASNDGDGLQWLRLGGRRGPLDLRRPLLG